MNITTYITTLRVFIIFLNLPQTDFELPQTDFELAQTDFRVQ